MKSLASLLTVAVAVFTLASCRGTGGGGPTTRACCSMDHAIYKTGEGISKAGHKIEHAVH